MFDYTAPYEIQLQVSVDFLRVVQLLYFRFKENDSINNYYRVVSDVVRHCSPCIGSFRTIVLSLLEKKGACLSMVVSSFD